MNYTLSVVSCKRLIFVHKPPEIISQLIEQRPYARLFDVTCSDSNNLNNASEQYYYIYDEGLNILYRYNVMKNILANRWRFVRGPINKPVIDLLHREDNARRLIVGTLIIVDRINHDIRSYIIRMFNEL